ncbi:hypothetical protein C100_14030 [Sphingobium sp. C100]|nr:hypothetical protein C100_14030 [Sphingobium sp. C100]
MSRRADAGGDVRCRQAHAIDEAAFEPPMDAAIARIALGIVAQPAIGIDRIMQWLRAIADIMAQANGLEGAMLLGHRRISAFGLRLTDIAHTYDQPIIGLDRGIGQGAGPADVGPRGDLRIAVLDLLIMFVEREDEFVA